MKKTSIIAIIAVFASIMAVSAPVSFAQVGDNSSDAAQDAAVVTAPGTDAGQDSESSAVSSESSQPAQDSAAGFTASPSTDAAQDNFTPSIPSAPETPAVVQNGGGSRSSSGGHVNLWPFVVAAQPATTSCQLITAHMKSGWANPKDQVTKLQVFLKDIEHMQVAVTGIYDEQTIKAVESFQRKYLETVMGPWQATRPSGVVYITTLKKINQIACSQPLVLNPSELAVINKYIAGVKAGTAPAVEIGAAEIGQTVVATGTAPAGPEIGETESESGTEEETAAAAVGGASIIQRFWGFLKSVF